MIANNRISAVLVSTDLARSQEFYENKVGLKLSPKTIKNHCCLTVVMGLPC